jgi:hypothetical protein
VEAFIEELVDTRINCHLKHMGTSVQNFKAERSFSDLSRILSFKGFVALRPALLKTLVVPVVRKSMM